MRRFTIFTLALLFCAGCASVRKQIPDADFQLQKSEEFWKQPPQARSVDEAMKRAD